METDDRDNSVDTYTKLVTSQQQFKFALPTSEK